MGKKTNTILVIGGIALGIYALSKALGKPAVDVSGGGGLISDLANLITGGEVSGGAVPQLSEQPVQGPPGSGARFIDTWQPTVGVVSPTDVNYSGGYPALDVNEQGLFVNRATGEVYPVDPVTGRQRARIDEQGNVVGRFIASPAGVPYGTYEYSAPTKILTYGAQAVYKQTLTSLATGQQQEFITGASAAGGKAYATPASTGWYSISAAGKSSEGSSGVSSSSLINAKAAASAMAKVTAAYGL